MATTDSAASDRSINALAILGMVVGLFAIGYGIVLVPDSALGGFHVVAIGVSFLLGGFFATAWAGEIFGVSAANRRRLSLGFTALAVLLLLAFVAINFASFEGGEFEESS